MEGRAAAAHLDVVGCGLCVVGCVVVALGCAFLEEREEFPGIPFFGPVKKKERRSF